MGIAVDAPDSRRLRIGFVAIPEQPLAAEAAPSASDVEGHQNMVAHREASDLRPNRFHHGGIECSRVRIGDRYRDQLGETNAESSKSEPTPTWNG
jgi:hypothetical protein